MHDAVSSRVICTEPRCNCAGAASGRCASWSSKTKPGSSRSSRAVSMPRDTPWSRPAMAAPGSASRPREHWDLVVLDLLLPELTGSGAAGAAPARPGLPVVILSARADVATKLRSFELGATDHLAKPFSLDELLARMRRPPPRRATFGDEHVLLGGRRRRSISRAGKPPSATGLCGPLRPRVPAAAPPAAAPGRGREPRAAALRGLGLPLRPGLERRRGLRAPVAAEARSRRADRDGPPCGLPPCCASTGSRSRGGSSRSRTSARWSLAGLGDDPVPLHLDQPHPRLRRSASGRRGTTAPSSRRGVLATGLSIFSDAFDGIQLWGELFEVPLMSAMFLAMVWHARRRQ